MFDVSSLGKHNCHETSRSKVNSKMEQAISFQFLGDSDLAGCQSRKGLQADWNSNETNGIVLNCSIPTPFFQRYGLQKFTPLAYARQVRKVLWEYTAGKCKGKIQFAIPLYNAI